MLQVRKPKWLKLKPVDSNISMKTSSDMLTRVEEALNSIRPYLEADGGDVKVLGISEDLVVRLELTGACSICPMSTMTMKAGVEEAIKKAVPEVKSVEAISVDQELLS
jgi:Fe-S cluster biogenesis protein NfuA